MYGATAAAWEDFGYDYLPEDGNSIVAMEKPLQPSWLRQAVATIERLLNLKANWDSYDAMPINKYSAYYAIELLEKLCERDTGKPSMVPTKSGNIQVEWHVNNVDLELEITSDSKVLCYFDDLDDEADAIESTFSYDWEELTRYIQRVAIA